MFVGKQRKCVAPCSCYTVFFSKPEKNLEREYEIMLPRRWMEAYVHFLLRYRWLVIALSCVITLFSAITSPTQRSR